LTRTYSAGTLKLIGICFLLSGATGLIYEVLWARMLGLVFGATTIAISAVLAAFMGGLALGSALAARLVTRIKRPVRAYALIEIVVGVYAVTVPYLFRAVDQIFAFVWLRFAPGLVALGITRFILAGLVLLIPTALMGATLAVLAEALQRAPDYRPAALARLYTLNLTGAILGTVVAGFVLLPELGIRATTWIAALTNIAVGVAAWLIDRASVLEARIATSDLVMLQEEPAAGDEYGKAGFWLSCAFVSGLMTIAMQVVWSRVLTMIIGSSTYAFSIVLALFLIGLSLGAYIVSLKRNIDPWSLRRAMLIVQATTVVALFLSLRLTSATPNWLIVIGFRVGISSWFGLLALQILIAGLLILLPALLMGMVMPLVLTWAGRSAQNITASSSRAEVGQAYAVNTIGAIAGALVTSFILIPGTSTRFTVLLLAGLALFVAAVAFEPRSSAVDRGMSRSVAMGTAFVLLIVLTLIWPRLNLNALSSGSYDSFIRVLAKSRAGMPDEERESQPGDHQLLMYKEGRTATVSVRRDWGITSIAINGRTNASDADDMPTQIMLGELGVLMAPRLNRSLIIGFATGVTAGSVLQSSIQSLQCVELESAAIASSFYFEHVNNHPLEDPRLQMLVDDGRTHLRVNPQRYDFIISEPSHPWVPGVANLFTREFFSLGLDRLEPDGIFVQWVQTYQLSNQSLQSVLATFHEVFPHLAVFRIQGAAKGKDLILIGGRQPIVLDRINERMQEPRTQKDLDRIQLKTPEDVLAWFVCDERVLGPAVAGAIINTDDNMHVETTAPREAFQATIEANGAWIESLRQPRP
jgi:spermidine synthase